MLCDEEFDLRNEFECLHEFLECAGISSSKYPQLTDLVLEVDLDVCWDDAEGPPTEWTATPWILDPEDVYEELDALLISIVHHSAIEKITIQWAETQTYIGPECEESIRSMFPALSGNDMLSFRSPA